MSDENQEMDPTAGAVSATAAVMNQLQNAPADPTGRLTTRWLYQLVSEGSYMIANIMALPAEVLLRHRFGERFLDPVMLLVSGIYTFLFTSIGAAIGAETTSQAVAQGLIFWTFVGMSFFHLIQIKMRWIKGVRWHADCPGQPWPIFLKPATRLLDWIFAHLPPWARTTHPHGLRARAQIITISYMEPVYWILLGLIIGTFTGGVGLFWYWTGICLATKATMLRFFSKQEIMDLNDRRIEAEHKQAVMEGLRSPEEADGMTVWSSRGANVVTTPATPTTSTPDLPGVTERLDPSLRGLLIVDDPGQTSAQRPAAH